MLRVGLTGGIGAGKSTVAGRLADLGAVVVDADRLAREVVAPGSEGLAEVRSAFGESMIGPGGELDRAALARAVFADPAARVRLETITHPRIAARTAQLFAAAERELGPAAVAVHDVPLLVEKQMAAAYHLVVVVDAPVDLRVERLAAARRMSQAQARSRIAAQADEAARRAAADVWLDNSGSPPDLLEAVEELWRHRVAPFADNLAAGRPAPGRADEPDAAARRRLVARVRAALGGRLGEVSWSTAERGVQVRLRGEAASALADAGDAVAESAGYALSPVLPHDAVRENGMRRYLSCDPGRAGSALSVVAFTV